MKFKSIITALTAAALSMMTVCLLPASAVPTESAEEYMASHEPTVYTTSGDIINLGASESGDGSQSVKFLTFDNNVQLDFKSPENLDVAVGDKVSITYVYNPVNGVVTDILSFSKLDPEKDTFTANITLVNENGEETVYEGELSGFVSHIQIVQPEAVRETNADLSLLTQYWMDSHKENPITVKGLIKGETYALAMLANSKSKENIAAPIILRADENGECNINGTVHLVSYYRTGDINYDGQTTIADLIMLNNYLLHTDGDYVNNRFWDVTEDGVVNAFDLCALKDLITQDKAEK